MDIKQSLTYRSDEYSEYNNLGDKKYNYKKHGILNKVLPKVLFKGNSILVTFLQLIDLRIIMMLKYVDRLKKDLNEFIKEISNDVIIFLSLRYCLREPSP